VRVVDGRTLVVRIERRKVTVRLLGVETPARASLFTQYLTFGRHVALEREPGSPDRDERGRLFRNVHLDDGTFLNAELVKRGYATPDTELPCSHAEAFEAFDRHAREEALGQYTGTVSPIVLEPGVAEVRPGLYMSGIDGTGQPTLIPGTKIRPIYPQMARRTGGWERVVLQAVVRKDGTVGDICILSAPPGGIGFEESAVAAVSDFSG
jgi:micrococcal nuclease